LLEREHGHIDIHRIVVDEKYGFRRVHFGLSR
jgi:hypothetical protein